MAKERLSSHLKLVVLAEGSKKQEQAKSPRSAPAQLPLLYIPDPRLLGLVDMAGMVADPFVALLQQVRPQWIMDLRAVPLFDLGGTNRRWFFDLFEQLGTKYRDVSGRLGITSTNDASLASGHAAHAISSLLRSEGGVSAPGPLLVLLDGPESVAIASRVLPQALQPMPRGGWELHCLNVQALADASDGSFIRTP
ncbi:hypothetical protein [Corallococcus sp. 4LFB]|uniref:hypothetical protein n=1 Tax=Corallococcus sp. 4LFB TaxID=3383249 RepID=UPI003974EFCB